VASCPRNQPFAQYNQSIGYAARALRLPICAGEVRQRYVNFGSLATHEVVPLTAREPDWHSAASSNQRGSASVGSERWLLASGARGREFESPRSDQLYQQLTLTHRSLGPRLRPKLARRAAAFRCARLATSPAIRTGGSRRQRVATRSSGNVPEPKAGTRPNTARCAHAGLGGSYDRGNGLE
jgi:hypothetical protein